MNLGATELLVILVVVLLLFGPSRLPGLGKAVGETIRGFKKGMNEELEKPVKTAEIREPDSYRSGSETVRNSSHADPVGGTHTNTRQKS